MMKKSDPEAENERKLLLTLSHENIVRYFDHFQDRDHVYVVLEYCEQGNLRSKIRDMYNSGGYFEENTVFKWIFASTNAVKSLHSKGVIHRDLKPENILLTKDGEVKVADLGCAKIIEGTVNINTLAGSIPYMSPEQYKSMFDISIKYSLKCDVWALGCILYELLNLRIAFPEGPKDGIPVPDLSRSPRFKNVLTRMLQKNAAERIESEDLFDDFNSMKKYFRSTGNKFIQNHSL